MASKIPKEMFSFSALPNVDEYYKRQGSERGKRTWEWLLPGGQQITFYLRLARENFAGHFHKGDDPSKNPELFVLLRGKMKFVFRDLEGNCASVTLDAATGPQCLTIQPWAFHDVVAETDVLYAEYRETRFNPDMPDTYPEEEFHDRSASPTLMFMCGASNFLKKWLPCYRQTLGWRNWQTRTA